MEKILDLIKLEEKRQEETLDFIPSENIVSKDVLTAIGSVLTNKYAEGKVGARYYQGNEIVDQIEQTTIDLAKKVFGAKFINVKALSGSPSNLAVYTALLNVGDKILGFDIRSGGHLTFGQKISLSGKLFDSHFFSVNKDTEILDYDEVLQVAKEVQPKLIVCGTSAYPRDFDWKRLKEIADSVGAYLLADISHTAGLIASGFQNSPIGIANVVTSTTHKTLRGPRGALIMTNEEELSQKIDRAVFLGLQGGPHLNTIAGIGVALEEAFLPYFKTYASQVIKNAKALVETLSKHGFRIVTGGTDNHLVLVDLRNKNISGIEAAVRLEKVGIITNANLIPFDPNPPKNPSGVRFGTPSVTTRGLKEKEMIIVASWINDVVSNRSDPKSLENVEREVLKMCSEFQI